MKKSMSKYRVHGIEGPTFTITVEAQGIADARKKAEAVYDNHFAGWPDEKIDEAWENDEQQDHIFDEIEVIN